MKNILIFVMLINNITHASNHLSYLNIPAGQSQPFLWNVVDKPSARAGFFIMKKLGYNADYKSYKLAQTTHPKRQLTYKKKYVNSRITFDEFFSEKLIVTKEEKIIKNQSYGESLIFKWLTTNDIKFAMEKEFRELINPLTGQKLRMDFYLPKQRLCIEFDGKQHYFKSVKFDVKNDDLSKRQYRDKIKNAFCLINDIKMVRIKYSEVSLISSILQKEITI